MLITQPPAAVVPSSFYPASVGTGTQVTVTFTNVAISSINSGALKYQLASSSNWLDVPGASAVSTEYAQWNGNAWDSGVEVKFNMIAASSSGSVKFGVEVGGTVLEATKFDLDFVASGTPRVESIFPEFDSVCGGSTLTVSLTDATSFVQSGLVLRFLGTNSEHQDVAASAWDSTTQQATFTTPRSLRQTAGVTSVQVRHGESTCAVKAAGTNANCAAATTSAECTTASTAGTSDAANVCVFNEQFVSSNLVFEYLTTEPALFSTSPKITDGTIKLIPSQKTPVTITVDGLGVSSAGDLSITLSGGGTSVSLTASNFKYEAVTGQISFRVTPPSDTTTGLKTLTIASASCSSSKLQISLKMEASSATASPNRHTTTGGTSTLIVSNAPHTNAMPWGTGALTFKCGTNEGQVSYVSKWTATATTVVVLVPAGTVTSGQTETATSCTIYRTADTTKTGPVFDITYYLSYAPYIVNKGNAPPLPCQAPHSYHHTQRL